MTLEFTYPEGDPRSVVAARLRIVCPHHYDELIVDWCTNADGDDWLENIRGYRTENVSEPGTIDAVKRAGSPIFTTPDAEAEPGQKPHLRGRFRCPRASCGYDGQITTAKLWPKVDEVLAGMLVTGMTEMTVTNVDTDWLVVRT